ncbi:MAG: Ppx/GppA phosphatase family protein, partial [Candidatus Eutrophobiaceae bacterium]
MKRETPSMAVLDLGSNSFHLVVARVVEDTLQILHKDKQIVGMAAGLDEQLMLSAESMERGLEVLAGYRRLLDEYHPVQARIVGTHTLRSAVNRLDFLRRAESLLNFPIDVISGDEEARLIYQGVAHNRQLSKATLVVDIGGGSTEFVLGKGFDILDKESVAVGSVTLSGEFFSDGRIDADALRNCRINVERKLLESAGRFRNQRWKQVLATSGSFRVIAQYAHERAWIEDSNTLTPKLLEKICKELLRIGHCSKIEGLGSNRARIFPAAIVVALGIMECYRIESMETVSYALRDGVLHELADSSEGGDIRERTIESLTKLYYIDVQQAMRVSKAALSLFGQMRKEFSPR